MTTQKKNLASNAAIVMTALVASRVTGFIRQTLVPNILGSSQVGDAYDFAFRISDLMFYLLVGGAISASLIPVLTGYLAKDEEKEGWKAVSTFINTISLIMVVFVGLGILFADRVVPLLAIGYNMETDREQLELIIRLTRILLPSVGLLMMAGMVNGVLNSYNRFAAAAFGPVLYNILSAMSILLLSKISVESVAVGVMLSSLAYFLFQLSFALKNLKYYVFRLYWKHQGFRRMFRLAVPSLISSSIAQVNVFITSMFTTLFEPGSIVALNIADRIWQTPYGIFAQGMGIAMLPTMSANHATGDVDEYKRVLMKGLRTVLLLSVPSAAGLVVLREQIIDFFRFSAMFSTKSMITAQNILMFFTIALLAQSMVAILIRAFYAVNDTKTPLFTGLGMVVLNILLSRVFYEYTTLGAGGMALAYSAACSVNAVLLIILLNIKLKGIGIRDFLRFFLNVSIASAVMYIVLHLINIVFGYDTTALGFSDLGAAGMIKFKLVQFVSIIIKIAAGASVYFFMLMIMRIEEGTYMLKVVLEKLKWKKI